MSVQPPLGRLDSYVPQQQQQQPRIMRAHTVTVPYHLQHDDPTTLTHQTTVPPISMTGLQYQQEEQPPIERRVTILYHHQHNQGAPALTQSSSLPEVATAPQQQQLLQRANTLPASYPRYSFHHRLQSGHPPLDTYSERSAASFYSVHVPPHYQSSTSSSSPSGALAHVPRPSIMPQSTYVAHTSTLYHSQPSSLPPRLTSSGERYHSGPQVDRWSPKAVNKLAYANQQHHWVESYHVDAQYTETAICNASLDNWKPSKTPPAGYGQLPSGFPSSTDGEQASGIDYAAIPVPKNSTYVSPYSSAKLEQVHMPPFRKMSTFRPTGRKRALIIGINYSGVAELNGPISDVQFIRYLLRHKFGFQRDEILVLTDRDPNLPTNRRGQPTRQGILDGMNWLVNGAMKGDSLWCSFSGHGAQIPDTSNDEPDGLDEAILPVDYKTAGYIVDDEINNILVRGTPIGARLTALFDACHCGSGMDLPCEYDIDGRYTYTGRRVSKGSRLFRPAHSQSADARAVTGVVHIDNPEISSCNQVGEVLLFSGCKDDEMSAENHNGASMTGVMTYTLIQALEWGLYRDWRDYNYLQLMEYMTSVMKGIQGCEQQTPQFSTSFPFDLHSPFCI